MNIITKTMKTTTWTDLKAAAEVGTIDDLIQSGDLIPFALKTGEEVTKGEAGTARRSPAPQKFLSARSNPGGGPKGR